MKGFASPSAAASSGSSLAGVAVDAEGWGWDGDSLCVFGGGASLCAESGEASEVELASEGVALIEVLVQELVRQAWGSVWVM